MARPEDLVPLARRAEDVGVSVLTVADHLDDQLAPIAALMAAADATTTLRVGTLVFANDYRHPALLAKEAATVDRLSGGRLEFGLGAGWMTTDYTATGIPLDPPSVRIARLEEALEVIRALWSGEPVEHHGCFYDISGLVGTPRPPSRRSAGSAPRPVTASTASSSAPASTSPSSRTTARRCSTPSPAGSA